MKSHWNPAELKKYGKDALGRRVYTSRLLGREPGLVLHGGGNTSVKVTERDRFGQKQDILYVKGSGWDLATIERAGFAPVKMEALLRMATLNRLSDGEMVKLQRAAMTDPYAPNPSVEAVLHAIIPFKYVDHTHADAVVTITNTPEGRKRIRDVYGPGMLAVPYVMPGFILAKKVYDMTRALEWGSLKGMVLMNHGIFSFHDDAKESYERMIRLVSRAERYLKKQGAVIHVPVNISTPMGDLTALARLRREVSNLRGSPVIAKWDRSRHSMHFSRSKKVASIATRGPLTPDHVIRTKRVPAVLGKDIARSIERFGEKYRRYFKKHARAGLTCLDPAPRWAVWPKRGNVYFGRSIKEVTVISDIVHHTTGAIQRAEKFSRWKALPAKDIFDVEYWELEQAKLKKSGSVSPFQGRVAFVTGAASGIGKACVESFLEKGAVVAAVDIDRKIKKLFDPGAVLSIHCDVTDHKALRHAVDDTVKNFGGLDIVVCNAGIFPPSAGISQINDATWQKSLDINLSSHQKLMQYAIPYLRFGLDPSIVVVGSKNVPAPGPGASAYSVAKAGLTQLSRAAALELAEQGIRVNVIHPNQVFDTGIWTDEVIKKRAGHYKMSVEEYKTSNLLKTTITSREVAAMVLAVAGPVFAKTTGAQIPVDGGNERVI